MEREYNFKSDLVTVKTRAQAEDLLDNYGFYIKGLYALAKIVAKTPNVRKRYESLINTLPADENNFLAEEKTLTVSFSALEEFSGLKMENLHKDGLIVPMVLMYKALACKWDDCFDRVGGKSDEAAWNSKDGEGKSAGELWTRGINLIKANQNIPFEKKNDLIADLTNTRDDYLFYETKLKEPETFHGLDGLDTFTLSLEMRKRSFGRMAKVMTRVFNKGEKDEILETKMANTTLALGVIDGFMDLKEDGDNGVMTEARAYVEHKNMLERYALIEGIKLAGNLLN